MRVLLLAWGNPSRGDDGLGPAFAERAEGWARPDLTVSCDYQLQVEDAAVIAGYDAVVFVDASDDGPAPFGFTRVEPRDQTGFSSHSLRPDALLALGARCFGLQPPGWLLAIRGRSFAPFHECLSADGAENLEAALEFFEGWLDSAPACQAR